MSSHKILSGYQAEESVHPTNNDDQLSTFRKYVGKERYEILKPQLSNINLEKYKKTMNYMVRSYNNKEIMSEIQKDLTSVFKKFILPRIPDTLKHKYNVMGIHKNLKSFFSMQRNASTVHECLSVLEYQHIFLIHFKVFFLPLVMDSHLYIHNEIYSLTSNLYEDNPKVQKFVQKYMNDYTDITYKPTIEHKELVGEDMEIFKMLETIFNDMIKKLQKINSDSKMYKFLTYGSFTNHLLNKSIRYNDVDMYHPHPQVLLTTFLSTIKILLDIDVTIFKIPMILGHLSLVYNNHHFADCLYLDEYTMDSVPRVYISGVQILHPIVQTMNMFRMFGELSRIDKMGNPETRLNSEKKLTCFIQYLCKDMDIDIEKDLVPTEVDVSVLNENIILHLDKAFKLQKNYNDVSDRLPFKQAVISRSDPDIILQYLRKKNVIMRRQYFGLYNEIVGEIYKQSKPVRSKEVVLKKIIRQEDVEFVERKTIEKGPEEEIDKIIDSENTLFLSNFTSFYYECETNNNYIVEETRISSISVESLLSSFVLSQILANQNDAELVRFYFVLFLSFINSHSKKEDLEMIGNKDPNKKIKILRKYKLPGKHHSFSLTPKPYISKIFFYNHQDKDSFPDFNEFLKVCSYNYSVKK